MLRRAQTKHNHTRNQIIKDKRKDCQASKERKGEKSGMSLCWEVLTPKVMGMTPTVSSENWLRCH